MYVIIYHFIIQKNIINIIIKYNLYSKEKHLILNTSFISKKFRKFFQSDLCLNQYTN